MSHRLLVSASLIACVLSEGHSLSLRNAALEEDVQSALTQIGPKLKDNDDFNRAIANSYALEANALLDNGTVVSEENFEAIQALYDQALAHAPKAPNTHMPVVGLALHDFFTAQGKYAEAISVAESTIPFCSAYQARVIRGFIASTEILKSQKERGLREDRGDRRRAWAGKGRHFKGKNSVATLRALEQAESSDSLSTLMGTVRLRSAANLWEPGPNLGPSNRSDPFAETIKRRVPQNLEERISSENGLTLKDLISGDNGERLLDKIPTQNVQNLFIWAFLMDVMNLDASHVGVDQDEDGSFSLSVIDIPDVDKAVPSIIFQMGTQKAGLTQQSLETITGLDATALQDVVEAFWPDTTQAKMADIKKRLRFLKNNAERFGRQNLGLQGIDLQYRTESLGDLSRFL